MKFVVSKNEPIDWTPPSMADDPEAPVFKVSYLGVRKRAEIADGAMYIDMDRNDAHNQRLRMQSQTVVLNTAVASITSWSNVYTESGAELKFDGKAGTIDKVLTAIQRNNRDDYKSLLEACSADDILKDKDEEVALPAGVEVVSSEPDDATVEGPDRRRR